MQASALPADSIQMTVRAAVARENQLAAHLLAAMFKANVTSPPVTLGQKWVSGGISMHCSENEEEPEFLLTESPHQWSCCRTHTSSWPMMQFK